MVLFLSLTGHLPTQAQSVKSESVQWTPLAERSRPVVSTDALFNTLQGASTGLTAGNQLTPPNMRNYLLGGAGICTADYDADGLVDVYLVSQDGSNHLYRQTAPWQFEDVTAIAGAGLDGGDAWGSGATFVDADNDGDLDLYVCNINKPNLLFMNQGDGSFQEEGEARGVAHAGATTMASFADYDRDGDLDLYLVNNRVFYMGEEKQEFKLRLVNGVQTVHPDFRDQYFLIDGRVNEAGQRDRLFLNDGRGKFVDISYGAGIETYDMGLSATWWDYNLDGWPDLYVANDLKTPDRLYRNNQDGTFTDVIAEVIPQTPWFSMGADQADLNGDGIMDLLVADMSSTTHFKQKTTMGEMGNSAWFLTYGKPRQYMRNAAYLSSGRNTPMMQGSNLLGLDSTDWTWSVKFGDYDNDGRADVFFTNGIGRNINDSDIKAEYDALVAAGKTEEARAQLFRMPPLEEKNLLFRNSGGLRFEDVSQSWGLDYLGVSHGASAVDLDRDGDLDLLVNNMNAPMGVFRNDSPAASHAMLVALRGKKSNAFGIGARVTVVTEAQSMTRVLTLARGYMSADDPVLHFGLGEETKVKTITVHWPSGTIQSVTDLPADQMVTIHEPVTGRAPVVESPTPEPLFAEVTAESGLQWSHKEKSFDDFAVQPLLPEKLSQLGPGSAWGDVNGDGTADGYIGGAAGQDGVFFMSGSDGRHQGLPGQWYQFTDHEDMGSLLADFDSDGDLDLYVVSGGVENEGAPSRLQDRLFLYDAKGGFFRLAPEGSLPATAVSGSCVVGADYDRDGDIDLFVGGRVIPGSWPLTPQSQLLRNDGGRFVDVASAITGLSDVGMVTGGIWSDADGDGWLDLLVSVDWGSPRFFKNEDGRLIDHTEQAGLAALTGWWKSISAGDIDNDGDMDYVLGNVGLNTKYHASVKKPTQLFVHDFDSNGKLDLVEAEWEGDTVFPVRGRSCSSAAMPFIKDKFQTFRDFAMAGLDDIYSNESLSKAKKFEAVRLESSLLINDGDGRFVVKDLPRLAQIAPVFGSSMVDVDGDGSLDIFLVQNFLHPQPETGQMNGGVSVLLKGNGLGEFETTSAGASGLAVTGQGMAVVTTDSNNDSRPDFLVVVNDGSTKLFENRSIANAGATVKIQLVGLDGNTTGAGSRVTIVAGDREWSSEVYAGSGYLSQSDGIQFFGIGASAIEVIKVRWPNGAVRSYTAQSGSRHFHIRQDQ